MILRKAEEDPGSDKSENSQIYLHTFGDFDITIDGRSVFKKGGRKYKNLELLKYFITNRNRRIVPEHIIEQFWSDKDYEDPKNALSTQIHRLKKSLTELGLIRPGEEAEDYVELQFVNGFYIFSTGRYCTVDADEFKEKSHLADSLRKENPEKAVEIYREVVELYKGLYMEENVYSEWAINIRNKYHRMYVQNAIKLLELLMGLEMYNDIVDLFEDIAIIEPYEESLHTYFLEALIALKEYRYALSHYNYITTKMYKDVGVRPSTGLKNLYRRLLMETDENEEVDPFFIDKKLTEEELLEGSIFCETDYFKFAYNLERKKSLRYGKNAILLIVTVIKDESVPQAQLEKIIEILRDILWLSLRKSDLITRWNNTQILILLMNIKEQHLKIITRRVEQKFQESVDSNAFKISLTSKYVSSDSLS